MKRQELADTIKSHRNFLCVGLDTDLQKVPQKFLKEKYPLFAFNKEIIDATRDYCVAYKPNVAFYEAYGSKGWEQLEMTASYLPDTHFRIADAKRGDIGNTSARYAEAFFKQMPFDAVTVAPYMGEDSVTPFLSFDDKWVIVLGLTSNKGSADFQHMQENGETLFERVMRRTAAWGDTGNTMFVVGATHPEAFAGIRKIIPDHFLLVPGVGAQGGDLRAVAQSGLNTDGGLLINSTRDIIYASSGDDFQEAAAAKASILAAEMSSLLAEQNL